MRANSSLRTHDSGFALDSRGDEGFIEATGASHKTFFSTGHGIDAFCRYAVVVIAAATIDVLLVMLEANECIVDRRYGGLKLVAVGHQLETERMVIVICIGERG